MPLNPLPTINTRAHVGASMKLLMNKKESQLEIIETKNL
jgi:hypothetical protein